MLTGGLYWLWINRGGCVSRHAHACPCTSHAAGGWRVEKSKEKRGWRASLRWLHSYAAGTFRKYANGFAFPPTGIKPCTYFVADGFLSSLSVPSFLIFSFLSTFLPGPLHGCAARSFYRKTERLQRVCASLKGVVKVGKLLFLSSLFFNLPTVNSLFPRNRGTKWILSSGNLVEEKSTILVVRSN